MVDSVMHHFGFYLTPEQAYFKNKSIATGNPDYPMQTLEDWIARSKINVPCTVCGVEKVWRYGGLDLCFYCMTGESDASDDYELIYGGK
jgi:hypothetical protein